ncbi:MAG: ROK family protein [Acidimicrobiales bacterium]|nr:ROK family protein [Acidimicrobiales bacterium]
MAPEVGSLERGVLALDVGGTKIAAGEVTRQGRILRRQVVANPRPSNGDDLFQSVVDLLSRFAPFDDYLGLGVGCGGPMTLGGTHVSPINIPAWRQFPLHQRLSEHCQLPLAIDNDAKALALAEGWVGAAVGYQSYIAMVVSTGVGGGIVLNGRLLHGDAGNAGHIGHVMVCPDSLVAPPQHVPGMLESEASGTGIQLRIGAPAVDASTADIRRTGMLVGRAVASVANLLDLRLAVVAGSVALGYGEPFFSSAQAEMDRLCVLDHSRGARIRPAGLGADGPLVGAAAVVLRHLGLLPRSF